MADRQPVGFIGATGTSVSLIYDTRERSFRGFEADAIPGWVRDGLSSFVGRIFGADHGGPSTHDLRWEAFARELGTHGHVVLETGLGGGDGAPARVEVALTITEGSKVLVRARDVSNRARLLGQPEGLIDRLHEAADLVNIGVAMQDAAGMCTYASARMLALVERNPADLPVRTESFFDATSWPELARQMQKRRFGIMTPYRALARAGRWRVKVVVSPIPIFGPDGTFRGSLATFTEDVGGGAEESLNRYRDEVQAVVAAGSELVLQLDHLAGGEKAPAAQRQRPRRGTRRGTRTGSPRQAAMAQLTPKEREIAGRLTTGMRVAEIANALTISVSTVRNHLKSIFRKLDVRSQIELVTLLGR